MGPILDNSFSKSRPQIPSPAKATMLKRCVYGSFQYQLFRTKVDLTWFLQVRVDFFEENHFFKKRLLRCVYEVLCSPFGGPHIGSYKIPFLSFSGATLKLLGATFKLLGVSLHPIQQFLWYANPGPGSPGPLRPRT